MDSQQQTNFTIMQQLPIISWALKLTEQGIRCKLINLIALLPTLRELDGLGININEITEEEWKELSIIAKLDGSRTQQVLLSNFKSDLAQSYDTFFKKIANLEDNIGLQSFQQISDAFKHYYLKASLSFHQYLYSSLGKSREFYALNQYFKYQKNAIYQFLNALKTEKFIKRENKIYKNLSTQTQQYHQKRSQNQNIPLYIKRSKTERKNIQRKSKGKAENNKKKETLLEALKKLVTVFK